MLDAWTWPLLTWYAHKRPPGPFHAVTLTGTAGSAVHTTPLTSTQAGILRDCQVTPPPRITALDPS